MELDRTKRTAEPTWHSRSVAQAAAALGTDVRCGLKPAAAADALHLHGPNALRPPQEETWWQEVFESLTEPLVLLLIVVGIVYAFIGSIEDAITIFVVIIAVAAIEVTNELRAKHALVALRELGAPNATVVRGGVVSIVAAREIVPGDLALLSAGRQVPADLRLTEAVGLSIDESMLTGESVAAVKGSEFVLPPETPLGDRVNLAFSATVVVAGKGAGIVVGTGQDTELGRIAELTEEAREPRTPLQRNLRELAAWMAWMALGFSVLVPALGIFIGQQPIREMVLTGLTLAFATIPEELPILITIVLGIGAYRLAQRHAIVKRLQAAETLGAVSVIATDKTGTLTENRMRVAEVLVEPFIRPAPERGSALGLRLLQAASLANDAEIMPGGFTGDPTETALLSAAKEAGVDVERLRAEVLTVREEPFDDVRKRMSVIYERAGERWLALKGAPESVLDVSTRLATREGSERLDEGRRQQLIEMAGRMAAEGFRVLGFADRQLPDVLPEGLHRLEDDLTFLGLAGLIDPPRPEAFPAIAELRNAGIRVIMITGDHPGTAKAIAQQVGIVPADVVTGRELEDATPDEFRRLLAGANVFARIAPEDKLRITQALLGDSEIVAVTGDGVNDAPALRQASVGVAMGGRGTDVARSAADIVLADDNFATLAVAVRAGRTLFANLSKAVRYYLAAKVGLIVSTLVPVLGGMPVPFVPVQIILLELFMDLGASTTFVAEPPEGDVMAHPPRDPRRPFMDRSMLIGILAGGAGLAAAVLAAYFWAQWRGLSLEAARTEAFVAWMVGHLVLAAIFRKAKPMLWRRGIFSNRAFLFWVAGAFLLLGLGATVPFIGQRLHLEPLSLRSWAIAAGAGLLMPLLAPALTFLLCRVVAPAER